MRFLVMQGPNLNTLGERDPFHYGTRTLAEIQAEIDLAAAKLDSTVKHFQSNSEGALVDWLQANQKEADGIIINPAGVTNYGISLRDALWETGAHLAIVHLSNLFGREEWRRKDVFAEIAHAYFAGSQWRGFIYALTSLHARFEAQQSSDISVSSQAKREGGLRVVAGVRWADLTITP